jgi:hypothetical protein
MTRARAIACALAGLVLTGCSSPHPSSPPPGEEVVLLPYPQDGGTVEWDGWAGTFVQDYCVQCHNPSASCTGNGCHATGELPDFRDQAAIVSFASMIRCGISVEQDPSWGCGGTPPEAFPLNGGSNPFPTDEQRGLVVAWIDAGCP